MFQRILVCTDGSACALAAVLAAATVARHHGAEITALNVFHHTHVSPAGITMWPVEIVPRDIADCAREEKEDVEQQIAPILSRLATPYRFMQEIGDPVEAILRVAKREKVDLIVVGSRGLRGMKELLLGSVSNVILHNAHCSVLIVRGDTSYKAGEEFQHILLASDGSPDAQKAVDVAVEMAQKFATSLTVLNVCEDLSSIMLPEEQEVIREEEGLIGGRIPNLYANRVLESVRQSVSEASKKAGVYCSYFQKNGDPYETIVRFADERHSDLIVIGSRGLGGLKQVLVGSVSNSVAHHASCPVLVVR